MNPGRDARAFFVGGGLVFAFLVAALVIQHLRHGWPFSLHHGLPPVGGARPASTAAPTGQGTAPSAEARAPVEVEPAQGAAIGVRVEDVRRETISRPLRAVATVVPDESRIAHVHTRVSGWIEALYINTTGEAVRAGQPVAAIFSQELLSSQNEYLAAKRGAGQGPSSVVLEGARARLQVLGMTDAEIRALDASGEARRRVTVFAPRSGIAIHRGVSVGTAVDPSTELLTIADLSRVWVIAEVPENEIPSVQRDTPARLEFPASGRPPFEARLDFLYPTLSERTRTLRVRFVVDNRDGALRPGLYGSVAFLVKPREALTVPRDAVVDTGASQHVFVVEHEGHFVPRVVTLGARLGERVEVVEGLKEGEAIVASGVFLIDSESRLRASGGGTGHMHGSHGGHSGGDARGSEASAPAEEKAPPASTEPRAQPGHPHGASPPVAPPPVAPPPVAPEGHEHGGHSPERGHEGH